MKTFKRDGYFFSGMAGALLGLYAATAYAFFLENQDVVDQAIPTRNEVVATQEGKAHLEDIVRGAFSPLGSDSGVADEGDQIQGDCEEPENNFLGDKEWQEFKEKIFRL